MVSQNGRFDFEGWHADPYIVSRCLGDFDVNITIDKEYTLGGSGYYKPKLDTDTKMRVLT
jgi:hypothetical protein